MCQAPEVRATAGPATSPAGIQGICHSKNRRQREHVRAPCFQMQALGSSGDPYPGLFLYQSGRQKALWAPVIDSLAQSPVLVGCPIRLAEDIHPQGWPQWLGLSCLPGPLLHLDPVRLCKKHRPWNLAQMLISYPVFINCTTLGGRSNLFEP